MSATAAASWDRRLIQSGTLLLAVVLLLLPAFYNGFPLVFHDTGAYLARAFESRLEPGRGPFYGFLIAATGGTRSLWPVILLQAAATVWLIGLTLRLQGLIDRHATLLAVLVLSVISGVAWGVATVMPDAFAPLLVLGWYLLVFGGPDLSRSETVGLVMLLLLAALVHITHLALLLGLSLCPGLFLVAARPDSRRGWALALSAPAIALLLIPLVNGLASDRYGFTPGGDSFVFGRLVQSGLIGRYLDEHCPDPAVRLCGYRQSLPDTGDSWLWDVDSPFRELGGFDGYADEMRRLTVASIRDHPWQHMGAAATAALEQLVRVGIGEDIDSPTWHTDAEIGRHLPGSLPEYQAARQHVGSLGALTSWLNRLYIPVTRAALGGLAFLLLVALARRQGRALPATIILALIGNAILCGVLSGPHDRYQGRIGWLASLAVIILAARAVASTRIRQDSAVITGKVVKFLLRPF